MAARSGNRRNREADAADAGFKTVDVAADKPEDQISPSEAQNRKMNDLVSELREISGQVNRMMSQVDHAIHRLGEHTHAAEGLKR